MNKIQAEPKNVKKSTRNLHKAHFVSNNTQPLPLMPTATSKMLIANLQKLKHVDELLTQFEQTEDKKILSNVTACIKDMLQQMVELSKNPESKTNENAPLLQELSKKMKVCMYMCALVHARASCLCVVLCLWCARRRTL